jgi:LacI family transcriptional regulator
MSRIPKVVLLIDTSEAFGRQFLRGIINYTKVVRPWEIYRNPPFFKKASSEIHKLEWLKSTRADGIISPFELDSSFQKYIKRFPVALTNEDVIADHNAFSLISADYLIDIGFKNFAFCGYEDLDWSRNRQEYFTGYLKKKGHQVFAYKPSGPGDSYAQEHENLGRWLMKLPKPIGIMAVNDDRGQDILTVCNSRKIRVPEEVAVIGVDNDDVICETCLPPLTSIAYNAQRAGFEAAKILDQKMQGKNPQRNQVVIKPTMIIKRQSTDILLLPDQDVARAIRFIHENIRKPIQVQDVVNQTLFSRKTLSTKFRAMLGRSIYDEIKRSKVEEIADMLINTKLPISEIALIVNTSGIDHISRYFQKIKGMTPKQYREKFGNTSLDLLSNYPGEIDTPLQQAPLI